MSQPLLKWSSLQLYQDGDSYFNDLLLDLGRAQKSITIEVYIFELDSFTRTLLEELEKARKRGCHVHLLVDGFGSYFWLKALEQEVSRRNLNLRIFRPLPRRIAWFRQFFIPYFFQMIRVIRKLNQRNHRKVVIIDQEIAYLGSLNMTQVHSSKMMGDGVWKDTGVRLTGGSLSDLHRAFWIAWNRAPRMSLRGLLRRRPRDRAYQPSVSLVRLNSTTWARYWLYRDLLRRIRKAQTRIWIETAYFLPKRSLLRALQKAARRGVNVEIIVPSRTDVPVIKWAAAELLRTLSESGVQIHEFIPQVLHSKFFLIDEWGTVGSHNWNHRSFLHDLEVEAVLNQEIWVKKLAADWLLDRQQSLRLTAEDLRPKNFLKAWLGLLAFRLRYLL